MLCDRCGEPVFSVLLRRSGVLHEAPFDRLVANALATKRGADCGAAAGEPFGGAPNRGDREQRFERVVVDTTVDKADSISTDARLTYRAIEKLVEMAKREGVELRQSYLQAWPNARHAVGAIRMPTSSALGGNSNSCARDLAASFADAPPSQDRGRCCTAGRFGPLLDLHCGFAIKSSASATEGLLMARPRWSIGRGIVRRRTSSAASGLPRQPPRPKADSSSVCQGAAWQSVRRPHAGPSSLISKSLQVLLSAESHGDKGYRATNYPNRFRSD